MERAHVSHSRLDEAGNVRSWWRLDFRTPQGIGTFIAALIAVAGAVWAVNRVVAVSVLDSHIRAVTRQEVAIAIQGIVNDSVDRAAKPHMEIATRQHEVLQEEIDALKAQVAYNRDEREKFQRQLMDRDEEQLREISALRGEMREFRASLDRIYTLLLKQESSLKGSETDALVGMPKRP